MTRMLSAVRPAAPADMAALRVPERTLPLLRDLISQQTGIYYDDGRLDLLRERLSPLAIERGFDSLLDYYYLLRYDTSDASAWPKVMDALSVAETYFWREADQLRALATAIVPEIAARRAGPIRIWSMPCATGEEPLSIAIALEEAGWFDRAAIEIHAADASGRALARAQERRYGERAFRQLPPALRDKYFSRDDGSWRVSDALFDRVTSWTRLNIMDAAAVAPFERTSDVVFCRNLFIYFTPGAIREVVARLAAAMPSPGYLCVGTAESLLRLQTSFELREVGGAYVYVRS